MTAHPTSDELAELRALDAREQALSLEHNDGPRRSCLTVETAIALYDEVTHLRAFEAAVRAQLARYSKRWDARASIDETLEAAAQTHLVVVDALRTLTTARARTQGG